MAKAIATVKIKTTVKIRTVTRTKVRISHR